jgi:hypothetical protein
LFDAKPFILRPLAIARTPRSGVTPRGLASGLLARRPPQGLNQLGAGVVPKKDGSHQRVTVAAAFNHLEIERAVLRYAPDLDHVDFLNRLRDRSVFLYGCLFRRPRFAGATN